MTDSLLLAGTVAQDAVQQDLILTQLALYRNPKSYAAWHHRRWLVQTGLCSLEHELKLINK